jgi:hypothetical protein
MGERGVAVDHVRYTAGSSATLRSSRSGCAGTRATDHRHRPGALTRPTSGGWQVEIPVPCRRQAGTSDRFHVVRPPEHQGGPPLSGQGAEDHAQLAAGVDHHRQAWVPIRSHCAGRTDRHRHRTSKYLNNRIEADHGARKRLTRPIPLQSSRLVPVRSAADPAPRSAPPRSAPR